MRSVILHYHIYKNAGMSVEDILDHNFGERFCRYDTADQNGCVSDAELIALLHAQPHLQALSSHQIRYPMPAVRGFFFFDVCFLRDPLDRIRSIYDYNRDKPVEGDPVGELARRLDVREFIAHLLEHMPHWCCEVQARLLAGTETPPHALGQGHLERALRTVRQSSFPGVVDQFEQSIVAGEFFLEPIFPGLRGTSSTLNATHGLDGTLAERKSQLRDACGSRVYEELERRNAFDLALLEYARSEVERRFKLASALRSGPLVRTAGRTS